MTLLKTITLEHTPSSHSVHIGLFSKVKNATYLIEQLRSGNTEYEYALIDARVILSEIHIYAACFQAISNKISNKLKTRNVHSEIVFCLSPKNNVRLTFSNLRTLANLDSQIAASFSNFGITPKTSDLVAVKIAEEALQNSIRTHLGRAIEGENIQFSDISLASLTDWVTVNKLYSLGGLRPEEDVRKLGKKEDFDLKKIEALVLSGMALRGATN